MTTVAVYQFGYVLRFRRIDVLHFKRMSTHASCAIFFIWATFSPWTDALCSPRLIVRYFVNPVCLRKPRCVPHTRVQYRYSLTLTVRAEIVHYVQQCQHVVSSNAPEPMLKLFRLSANNVEVNADGGLPDDGNLHGYAQG